MKSVFLIAGFVFLSVAFAAAQEPVFLSPYKDGHPFPEKWKDYSKPVQINLLSGGAVKTTVSKTIVYDKSNETPLVPVREEKITPVQLSNSKDKKASGKN